MLKIPIEIHPFGDSNKRRTLGIITIINNGTGDSEYGNYRCWLEDPDGFKTEVGIKHHKRDSGYLPLLSKVIEKVIKKRNAKTGKDKKLQNT